MLRFQPFPFGRQPFSSRSLSERGETSPRYHGVCGKTDRWIPGTDQLDAENITINVLQNTDKKFHTVYITLPLLNFSKLNKTPS